MARILIIDNDQQWRMDKLHDALEPLGHEILCESERSQAISLIRSEHLDLAVLNVQLNDREDNHTRIRQDCIEMIDKAVNRGIKVVVVTDGARLCPRREDYELTTAVRIDYHGDVIFKEDFSEIRFREKVANLVKLPLPVISPTDRLFDLGWHQPRAPYPWYGSLAPDTMLSQWQQTVNLLEVAFSESVGRISSATCRIEEPDGRSVGTGFAVAPDLVLTCNHVVPKNAKQRAYRVRFRFRYSSKGVLEQGYEYWVEHVVRSSDTENLDFSLLRIEGRPGDMPEIGYVRLVPKTPKLYGVAFVVQYPGYKPQKIALFHNLIIDTTRRRMQYLTHTEHGASGAPVFDKDGDIIALHHGETEAPSPSLLPYIRGNEGIPITAILTRIRDDLPYR